MIDSMRPSIFIRKKENNIAGYEKSISQLYCIIIYAALLQGLCMTLLAKLIVQILYGTQYAPSADVLRIAVWYTTFSYMGTVRDIWILTEEKQKYLWIVNLGGALSNIVLNWFLIPIYGVCGAAIASVITQFFANIIMNWIVTPLKYNNRLILNALNPVKVFKA